MINARLHTFRSDHFSLEVAEILRFSPIGHRMTKRFGLTKGFFPISINNFLLLISNKSET